MDWKKIKNCNPVSRRILSLYYKFSSIVTQKKKKKKWNDFLLWDKLDWLIVEMETFGCATPLDLKNIYNLTNSIVSIFVFLDRLIVFVMFLQNVWEMVLVPLIYPWFCLMVRLGASFVAEIWGNFGILNSLFTNPKFGHTWCGILKVPEGFKARIWRSQIRVLNSLRTHVICQFHVDESCFTSKNLSHRFKPLPQFAKELSHWFEPL